MKKIIADQIKYYSSYAKINNNSRYRKAWQFILNRPNSNSKILDVGCADGSFCQSLITRGFNCYGLEITEIAIKEASSVGLKIKKSSFLDPFPFAANYFDYVFAGEVLEHTLDDDFFLKQCLQVLKPRGVLIITVPNLVSLENRFLMFFGKLPWLAYAPFHYKIYTASVLEEKFKQAGFKILMFESSYVLVSRNYSQLFGLVGEWFGSKFPTLGKHLMFYVQKY